MTDLVGTGSKEVRNVDEVIEERPRDSLHVVYTIFAVEESEEV